MVKALVISGYGINCEEETLAAFKLAGAGGDILHINDLILQPKKLQEYQIISIAGGFSYGDDTGAGNGFAQKIRHHLWDEVKAHVERDTLWLGICNGCQVMIRLGLAPAEEAYGKPSAAVAHNASNRYQCRWVDVKVETPNSPWLKDIERMHIPVAHGEGNMIFAGSANLAAHRALSYIRPNGAPAKGEFPYNPNGSMEDCAGLIDKTGRVLALMPHPERGMFFTQRDDFPQQKERYMREGKPLPQFSDGIKIFQNAVKYFA